MLKLKLEHITKTYKSGEVVTALSDVSLGFRDHAFVAVLGPSGCGKTTLLNIIGGLDRYDQGDLLIDGLSTKSFKNSDWDAYRNHSIGFVFQTYNLLSGGQMQRVAIARALVNDSDIILADEPTGALDSQTSMQVLDLLKEISQTRLVIMVTHNSELAKKYSNRVIRLLDGKVQSDSNPVKETEKVPSSKKEKFKKTSMSLWTATFLSFRNLLTKRGRTLITPFAGSIGIIGVVLVLALSNGLSAYISSSQSNTLSGYPITITTNEQMIDFTEGGPTSGATAAWDVNVEFPDENVLYPYESEDGVEHRNVITQEYLDYIAALESELPNATNDIAYTKGVTANILAKGADAVVLFETMPEASGVGFGAPRMYWQELPEKITTRGKLIPSRSIS